MAQLHHVLDVIDQRSQRLHVCDSLSLGRLNFQLDQAIAAKGQVLVHLPQKLLEEKLTF